MGYLYFILDYMGSLTISAVACQKFLFSSVQPDDS